MNWNPRTHQCVQGWASQCSELPTPPLHVAHDKSVSHFVSSPRFPPREQQRLLCEVIISRNYCVVVANLAVKQMHYLQDALCDSGASLLINQFLHDS